MSAPRACGRRSRRRQQELLLFARGGGRRGPSTGAPSALLALSGARASRTDSRRARVVQASSSHLAESRSASRPDKSKLLLGLTGGNLWRRAKGGEREARALRSGRLFVMRLAAAGGGRARARPSARAARSAPRAHTAHAGDGRAQGARAGFGRKLPARTSVATDIGPNSPAAWGLQGAWGRPWAGKVFGTSQVPLHLQMRVRVCADAHLAGGRKGRKKIHPISARRTACWKEAQRRRARIQAWDEAPSVDRARRQRGFFACARRALASSVE